LNFLNGGYRNRKKSVRIAGIIVSGKAFIAYLQRYELKESNMAKKKVKKKNKPGGYIYEAKKIAKRNTKVGPIRSIRMDAQAMAARIKGGTAPAKATIKRVGEYKRIDNKNNRLGNTVKKPRKKTKRRKK
jgi:hypothetical protein